MPYILITLAIIALIVGPQLWVRFVLWRHSTELGCMPRVCANYWQPLV